MVLKVPSRFFCLKEKRFGVIGTFTPVKVGTGARARWDLLEVSRAAGCPSLAIELKRADILRDSSVGLAIIANGNAGSHHKVVLEP